jgi:hypothetical protein
VPGFILQSQLLNLTLGNKCIDQFFNGRFVIFIHLFYGPKLLQQLCIFKRRSCFFVCIAVDQEIDGSIQGIG